MNWTIYIIKCTFLLFALDPSWWKTIVSVFFVLFYLPLYIFFKLLWKALLTVSSINPLENILEIQLYPSWISVTQFYLFKSHINWFWQLARIRVKFLYVCNMLRLCRDIPLFWVRNEYLDVFLSSAILLYNSFWIRIRHSGVLTY